MAIIQLRHQAKLGYTALSRRNQFPAPEEICALGRSGTTVVTFRPLQSGRPDQVRRKMHACERLDDLPKSDLLFYGVESDSPLAPLLLWDAAHFLEVGRTLTLAGDLTEKSYLERDYFKDGLTLEHKSADKLVFRKHAELPAQTRAGLDGWTFGIPVGPEDATLLNVTVKRILELGLQNFEIVLCGRPGDNFKYFDQVRIVGEDITAPPVRICAKKNRLAQEARFENLCIIHDRVFLPRTFKQAVESFGDFFPLVALQCMYFDDRHNLIPRRYSDFGIAPKLLNQATKGLMRDNDVGAASHFSPNVLTITEGAGFYAANAMRHSDAVYPTGSLYICKRSIWLRCPQNENLHWVEFEDLDHAYRANALGIPSRVNPHAVTQSLIARPLLTVAGSIFYESFNGTIRPYRPFLEPFALPRKPLIKVTLETAQRQLKRFASEHVPTSAAQPLPSNAMLTSPQRLRTMIGLVARTRVPIQRTAIHKLLIDFEKTLAHDQQPYSWREQVTQQFLRDGGAARDALVRTNQQLINQTSQRLKRNVFAASLREYLPERGLGVYLGSLLSALMLGRKNRKVFYFVGGFWSRCRLILDTTPFREYAD